MAGGHIHTSSRARLGLAAILTGGFMLAEVAGGLISGSLALLADAGHMLTDFASLSLAWFAFKLSEQPADGHRTYGYDRFQILVAFANGLALFVITGWIIWEAFERFAAPQDIWGGLMLGVGIAGLIINIVAFMLLHGADRENLNIRGAAVHVMGDLLGSLAAITAAIVILSTGWTPIDPILSLVVAAIIARSALSVVIDSGKILLEAAPKGVDGRHIADDLTRHIDGLMKVHHVHVWSITQERPMVTLHARIGPSVDSGAVLTQIRQRLKDHFKIDHATIEIEPGTA